MRIRKQVTVVAFSADGESALLHDREDGPEGGGSLAYHVVSLRRPMESFGFSSNFSEGGPRRPQRVTATECGAQARRLAKALAVLGFSNVTVRPTRCTAARSKIVEVRGGRGSPACSNLPCSTQGWKIARRGDELRVSQGRAEARFSSLAPSTEAKVWVILSPTRRLAVVEQEDQDHSVVGVFGVAGGKLQRVDQAED